MVALRNSLSGIIDNSNNENQGTEREGAIEMANAKINLDTTEAMKKIAEARKSVELLQILLFDLNEVIATTTKAITDFGKVCDEINSNDPKWSV